MIERLTKKIEESSEPFYILFYANNEIEIVH